MVLGSACGGKKFGNTGFWLPAGALLRDVWAPGAGYARRCCSNGGCPAWVDLRGGRLSLKLVSLHEACRGACNPRETLHGLHMPLMRRAALKGSEDRYRGLGVPRTGVWVIPQVVPLLGMSHEVLCVRLTECVLTRGAPKVYRVVPEVGLVKASVPGLGSPGNRSGSASMCEPVQYCPILLAGRRCCRRRREDSTTLVVVLREPGT